MDTAATKKLTSRTQCAMSSAPSCHQSPQMVEGEPIRPREVALQGRLIEKKSQDIQLHAYHKLILVVACTQVVEVHEYSER